MTKEEVKVDIRNIADCIEELEKKVSQLEVENRLNATTPQQKHVNEWLIKHCNHSIFLLEKKRRYLLLFLEKPQNERHNLYDAITNPSSTTPVIRGYSPNRFLIK